MDIKQVVTMDIASYKIIHYILYCSEYLAYFIVINQYKLLTDIAKGIISWLFFKLLLNL